MLSQDEILKVSHNISNCSYDNNLEATEQLINVLDFALKHPCKTWEEYVKAYDDSFYTYPTFESLVKSEKEQGFYGFTEEECKEQINQSIWQLPCGWYVQVV